MAKASPRVNEYPPLPPSSGAPTTTREGISPPPSAAATSTVQNVRPKAGLRRFSSVATPTTRPSRR